MLTAMVLSIVFYAVHRKIMAAQMGTVIQITDAKTTNLKMHISMRETVPGLAFGATANLCMFVFILHFAGLATAYPGLSSAIIFSYAAFQGGILSKIVLMTAERLVMAEEGMPNADQRRGLVFELTLFAMLPLIVTLLL